MTSVQGEAYVAVVTSNSDLAAALPLHCLLPVEYGIEMAPGAAAVLLDHHAGVTLRDELAKLDGVPVERVVVITDEDHELPVGATVRRPVSLSDLCLRIDEVASRPSAGALPDDGGSPVEDQPVVDPPDDVVDPRHTPGEDPVASLDADVVAGPDERLFDDRREPDAVVGTTTGEPVGADSSPGDGGTGSEAAFVRDVGEAARAADALVALLTRYADLRAPDALVAAVAEEAVHGLSATMLGIWRRDPAGQLALVGGMGLRPSDRRRELVVSHPLVETAIESGGVLITSVADEPARVAGLPGSYCESLVLLPLDALEDLTVLVVAGGDGFGAEVLDQIEESLRTSGPLLSLAVALQSLRTALDA